CQAQITIEESSITNNLGQSYEVVLYETNLGIGNQLFDILAATGADQSWDFSNLNYVDSTITIETFQDIDPNDPFLQEPNLANSNLLNINVFLPVAGNPDTTFQFRYMNLEDGTWLVNGTLTVFDLDGNGIRDTLLQWFSPPSLLVQFPITSTSEWFDSTDLVQNFGGMPFTSSINIDSTWVEGWGEVTTPLGTLPALRWFNKSITSTPGFPFGEVSTSLEFATAQQNGSARINLEDEWAFYEKRTPLDGTTPVQEVPVFHFQLRPNYPNPFQGTTTLVFNLDLPQQVELRVLDLNGKVQQLITNNIFSAGEHQLPWNNTGLSAGHYLLEMRVGQQVQQRLMTVAR
ncbi:MAG: T9SS type A sorting domain-containing protein, partial [Bacteroidota bacterium]